MSAARRCTERPPKRRQRGIAMIEALVGMVVLSVTLGGSLMALARGARLQYANNLRAEVVDRIRAETHAGGARLCGTRFPLRAAGRALKADVACQPYANVSVSFPGVSAPVLVSVPAEQAQILTVTVESASLGGSLSVSSAN